METTVTGILADEQTAQKVVQQLVAAGFQRDSIMLVTNDTPDRHKLIGEETADLARGASLGAIVGAAGGAVAGIALPLLVPPFPMGPIGGAVLLGLLGAVAGAAIGLLVGSATGHQVQAEYEHLLEQGGVLVAVNTLGTHAHRVHEVLAAAGAGALSTSVHRRHQATASA